MSSRSCVFIVKNGGHLRRDDCPAGKQRQADLRGHVQDCKAVCDPEEYARWYEIDLKNISPIVVPGWLSYRQLCSQSLNTLATSFRHDSPLHLVGGVADTLRIVMTSDIEAALLSLSRRRRPFLSSKDEYFVRLMGREEEGRREKE